MIYDFDLKGRNDSIVHGSDLKGKVLLVVNTATGCGFTPQYEAIENLYKKYHDKGLEVLDFPCNQFGHQAPGDDNEIHEFCTAKYHTTFDQLKKVDVNGENADPFWKYIKEHSPEEYIHGMKNKLAMKGVEKLSSSCINKNDIKWNFTKFLVNREGEVVARYSPIEDPMIMEDKIKELVK